jgi:inner membrane protein
LHIQTHIMSGWCLANLVPGLTARERLLAMVAASVADVDGLGIVFGEKYYQDYHHVLGHNLLFAGVVSLVFAALSTHRVVGFGLYFALAHLHLLMDLYGSGPGWPICYWWPFRHGPGDCWVNWGAWEFYSWQNISAAFGMLAWTVGIAVVCRRTPLEAIMPELDRRLVGVRSA